MDNAYEVVVFALGLLCAILFLVCIFGAVCCNVNTNVQERFDRQQEVAYKEDDDLWYPGKRLPPQQATWLHRVRGFVHVETGAGQRRWCPSHEVVSLAHVVRPPHLRHLFPRYREPSRLEDGTAPVVGNLMRVHTPLWSFVINNVITALSTALGFEVRLSSSVSPVSGFFVVFGITFLSGFLIMFVFFWLFGFGEAMLAQKHPKVLSPALARRLFHKLSLQDGEFVLVSEANQMYAPRLQYNYASKVFLASPRARGV